MDRPLHSSQWHRVASLRPRWRAHARSDPQVVRGETWHVASGDGRTSVLRLDASAWSIAGRCDGERTMQAIWAAAIEADPEGAPTQDETIDLLARLVEERCIECEGWSDVAVLRADDDARLRRERIARLNPLAPRIALGDPTRLVRPLAPLGRLLFGRTGAIAWAALMLAAAAVAVVEADAIARHGRRWLDAPRYLLLAWVVWIPMKALHELAHALAVARWGGEVREAGIGLMVGFPVPYVDASAAHRFGRARERALVSAAGILAEAGLAAAGLLLWAATEPGWIHDAAFSLAVAGLVSTLFFNGNPLLRMDGYFVLCDVLGLPNLASRSGRWWQATWQRALGWTDARRPRAVPGERAWLFAYAPLSWAWRASLMLALTLWAGSLHRGLGLAVALAALGWLVVAPLVALLRGPARGGAPLRVRWRFALRAAALGAGVAIAAVSVPLPDRVVAPALVRLPDDAVLRAGVEGFVVSEARERAVAAGEVVLRLDDPALRLERERLLQALPGVRAELFAHLRTDPSKSRQAEEAMAGLEAALADADARLAQLAVAAPIAGRVAYERARDLPGRFVREGDAVGLVLDGRLPLLRVALDQDGAARVRAGVRRVDVRLAEAPGVVLQGRLLREAPAAAPTLPGAALGDRFGGPIPVDPADEDGLRPAGPVYVVDVALEDTGAIDTPPRPGGRAWVRFDHGSASLAAQTGRWLRQTVRARFAPDEQ